MGGRGSAIDNATRVPLEQRIQDDLNAGRPVFIPLMDNITEGTEKQISYAHSLVAYSVNRTLLKIKDIPRQLRRAEEWLQEYRNENNEKGINRQIRQINQINQNLADYRQSLERMMTEKSASWWINYGRNI